MFQLSPWTVPVMRVMDLPVLYAEVILTITVAQHALCVTKHFIFSFPGHYAGFLEVSTSEYALRVALSQVEEKCRVMFKITQFAKLGAQLTHSHCCLLFSKC